MRVLIIFLLPVLFQCPDCKNKNVYKNGETVVRSLPKVNFCYHANGSKTKHRLSLCYSFTI